MKYNALVANRIKLIRNEKGYAADFVANYLGEHKSTYSNLENGKTQINVEILKNLCELYKTTITYFLPELNEIVDSSMVINSSKNKKKSKSKSNETIECLKIAVCELQKIIEKESKE